MKLLLIRHAEPDYSIDSLTPKGRREAELLSRRLSTLEDVEAVYCSPLGRARDTAAPTLEKTGWPCQVEPWLREFHGHAIDPETGEPRLSWDFRPRLWKSHPALRTDAWTTDPLFAGGDAAQVFEETCAGLDGLLARHGYHRDGPVYRCDNNRRGSILLFCHFGIAMVMLGHLIDLPPVPLWQGLCMPPSSVTTLVTEERTMGEVVFRCMGMGDISHLWAAGERHSTAALYPEVYNGRDTTAPDEDEE